MIIIPGERLTRFVVLFYTNAICRVRTSTTLIDFNVGTCCAATRLQYSRNTVHVPNILDIFDPEHLYIRHARSHTRRPIYIGAVVSCLAELLIHHCLTQCFTGSDRITLNTNAWHIANLFSSSKFLCFLDSDR